MREIDGKAKTVRQLLSGTRYAIDYYQREYRWQPKQARELVEDLTDRFLQDYKSTDPRKAVQGYGHYFLGSIITSRKDAQSYIIDGQQRLTTLTLLLIYLHNLQGDRSDRVKLEDLIFSEQYGEKSFNIDVDERTPAMEALYNEQSFDASEQSESVRNIVGRYQDISDGFPEEIDKQALPYFADWLIDNVHLVEIVAYSDDDAYTIFETMNDRGLSLTPLEMLKGYLLANIATQHRDAASNVWKQRLNALAELGKEEDSDAVKTWLRSQYARTSRERKKGAQPGDFDRLGTEFHRWVKDNHEALGLHGDADFLRFIQRDLDFYTRQYLRLRQVSAKLTPELEDIFYIAQHGFTLQYPLLLAPLLPNDDSQTVERKLRAVAAYVDILLARRLWNFRTIAYSTMQYAMFVVMRDIRGKSLPELAHTLRAKLEQEHQLAFVKNDRLRLHQQNRFAIHQLLARITDYVERQSGYPSRFSDYVAEGKHRYEVEHIWANHPERHIDEFPHASDFGEHRNRIGGLLLLPKSFNASYSDMPYAQKREHYNAQNLLARSLHEQAYDHNPGFLKFIQRSGLPFKPHPQFRRTDLDARQQLYRQLAEQIWSPERISEAAGV